MARQLGETVQKKESAIYLYVARTLLKVPERLTSRLLWNRNVETDLKL